MTDDESRVTDDESRTAGDESRTAGDESRTAGDDASATSRAANGGTPGATTDRETGDSGPVDRGTGVGEATRWSRLPDWFIWSLPLALLAVAIVAFVASAPFAGLQAGEPLPDVSISYTTLPDHETIVLTVVNNGPRVTVEQLLVNDAYWDFSVRNGDATLGTMERAQLVIPYHWTDGWDVGVTLVLSGGATIHHTIVAPMPTPGVSTAVLWTLAKVGLFVGVIPVALGMLWFPALRELSDRWFHAVLAFSAGILAFLAFDAGFESLELAESVPGTYEGPLLVVFGAVGTMLFIQAVMDSGTGSDGAEGAAGASDSRTPLRVAYLVAVGIGLHNLAEGLAIGSLFAQGHVSLGAFLVIGFMVHNVTEGPAVVAPLARGTRPAWYHFVAIGAIAGAPVIFGGWLGNLALSPTVAALFLAIGIGAIVQVVWELRGLINRDEGRFGAGTNSLAFAVGLLVMYVTDLAVTL